MEVAQVCFGARGNVWMQDGVPDLVGDAEAVATADRFRFRNANYAPAGQGGEPRDGADQSPTGDEDAALRGELFNVYWPRVPRTGSHDARRFASAGYGGVVDFHLTSPFCVA